MSGSERFIRPMVVRAAGLPTELVHANPAITKKVFFSDFAGGHLVGTSVASHPMGEECGVHNHRGAVELFVVLEGVGIIELDGSRHMVQVDDCVLVPVGVMHNLIGVSEIPFRVLCAFVVAPGCEDDKTPWKPLEAS